MDSVIAVIVTYNRLSLLKEAITSVKNQSYPIKEIVVIDNGSTDETAIWLNAQENLTVVKLENNTGASGGFYCGIKTAATAKARWIWVMDDDTICQHDTLALLMVNTKNIDDKLGFIGSKGIWKDGEPHLMNVPNIKPTFNGNVPFNLYDQFNLVLTESNSWVSLLLNVEVIKQVGLPYKEFFHWSDDLEYTQRITRAGYLGFYCTNSIVLHNTPKNYCPDFYNETVNNIWKYKYGFRNEFFLKKKNKGFLYFIFWLGAKVTYTSFKIVKIRTDHHLKFIGVILNSAWKSIFFNPKIEKLQGF